MRTVTAMKSNADIMFGGVDTRMKVIEVEEKSCLVRFTTKTKRINKIALRPR